MSGIVAMIWAENGPAEATTLERITARMAYRGPDRLRTWSDAHAGLGHALLKLETRRDPANQPLTLHGQTWISADARIDARDLLATELRRHGSQITRDSPDAFLIAEAHRVFGTDCLQHLKGDFAFAIWDQPAQRLIAAVDRFAIRPLYYAWAGKTFIVASCLESLRLHPSFRAELDETAVGDFLLFGYYRDPAATIFAGAHRVPPAHMLVFEAGRLTIRRYWSPGVPTKKLPRDGRELVEEFKDILDAAVADRLHSDRTAILLSGGLDSAVIAHSACKRTSPGSTTQLHAHTAVYEHLIPDDEEEFAAQTARALCLPISFYPADEFEIFDWINRLGWMPPEPLDLPGLGATVDFHRRIAADSPVILTGHDGDTLFKASVPAHCRGLMRDGHFSTLFRDVAWYTYRQRRLPHLGWHRRWRKRPERTEPPALPAWLRPDWVRRSGLEERWQKAHEQSIEAGPRDRVLAALSSGYYARVFDRFDPAWTGLPVEFRHPLMDVRVVEFLVSLPALPWCVDKELFRRMVAGSVPEKVRRRKKTPLRSDPLVRQVFRRQEAWLVSPELDPNLDGFIDRSKLPPLDKKQSSDQVWALLRPIALSFWWRRHVSTPLLS